MRRVLLFWLRIHWTGPLTKPWSGYLDDMIRGHYLPSIREALNQPSALFALLDDA